MAEPDSPDSSCTSRLTPTKNLSSPYYLPHGDHPSQVLVAQLLTVENYSSWGRAVIHGLRAKRKLGFIDGTTPEPALLMKITLIG